MLDIQFIRDNPDLVQERAKQKSYGVDVNKLIELDAERRELMSTVEALRQKRNENAAKMQGGRPEQAVIDEGKLLKVKLAEREGYLNQTDAEFLRLLKLVPNMPLSNVPVGASEDDNKVVKTVGEPTKLDFEPKNHAVIGEQKGWIDKERATKVAGSRFTYIKGSLVLMQFAIMQWVMSVLTDEQVLQKIISDNNLDVSSKPFTPVLPPAIVKTEAYKATGRLNEEEVTYKLEGDEDQWLNASAEHSLCNMYMNEVLPADVLPLRYIGYATSFRKEAGTYGKDMEGIIRLHQFDKLEMESFTNPETGVDEHMFMIAIQEYLVSQLGLPYRLLQKCTFDIGFPNASGWDLEVWVPSQGKYRETHSADFMGDFQARGLKTRVKNKDGSIVFANTNDATAFALGRTMAFIIENYQTAGGDVKVPEVLKPFMGGRSII
jgi:seryl-tRNA synthetase